MVRTSRWREQSMELDIFNIRSNNEVIELDAFGIRSGSEATQFSIDNI